MPAAAPTHTEPGSSQAADDVSRGLMLGALGVLIFAATLPMTRLAVGAADAPQLPPAFVTAGRAAVAGLLSLAYLLLLRAPLPARRHWRALAINALGTVVGFPLFLALALRRVDAMHAAVVTGVLPLATAAAAALMLRQRASAGFWVCALLGCALVIAYAAWQGSGALSLADALLLLAVLSAAIGYVGMTGLATAPHLHYEFRINGVHRDPLKVTLPPPEPLPGALMAKFRAVTAPYIRQLAQAELRSATVAQR